MATPPGPALFRKWRIGAGKSQAGVGAELGVTANFIWRIESGTRRPSPELAGRIAALSKGQVSIPDWYPVPRRRAA